MNSTSPPTNQNQHDKLQRKMTNFSIDSIMGTATQEERKRPARKKSRPKNFQCPVCPMAFSNNGQLRNHVRIHTGERPFKCNFHDCGKTFTRNEELTRHKLIHSGYRPHACSACGKQFGRKDHLNKHTRTHEKLSKRARLVRTSGLDCNSTNKLKQMRPTINKKCRQKSRITVGGQQVVASSLHCSMQTPLVQPVIPSGLLDLHNSPHFALAQPASPLPVVSTSNGTSPLLSHFQISPQATSCTATLPAPISNLGNHLGQLATNFTSAATAVGTIQRLASDYWQNWYNLLGYHQYQQQQQQSLLCLPPEKKLESIMKKM